LPSESIFKFPNPFTKCVPRCRAPGACLPCKLRNFRKFRSFRRFLACITRRMPLESDDSHGWRVRIWIGAGGEPSCADECLGLFQYTFLLTREQPLTANSLVLWKSEKVLPDMLFYRWTFPCCPDETKPTCCR
jgi:hypothetical protein